MKRLWAMGGLAGLLMVGVVVGAEEEALQFKATVELKDGSRLVGVEEVRELPLEMEFATVAVPVEKVRQVTVDHKGGKAVVELVNGDRLTGKLGLKAVGLETAVGKVSPELEKIDKMTFVTWRKSDLPAGEGDVAFGGVNWLEWRTGFEVQGEKLVSLPKARAGFNYGHGGNGRGPNLFTNIGSTEWKDYRVEVEFCAPGVDAAMNPYGLGADFHDGRIMFHVVDVKESQNVKGSSYYYFDVHGGGNWTLGAVYNSYCDQPVGWGNPRSDGERTLSSGDGIKVDRVNGNKYVIEVVGKTISVSVDGEKVVKVIDEEMDVPVGGVTLDHGGVGFGGGFESMIWIKGFSARAIRK